MKIEWDDKKKNLFDWYTSLNHAGGLSNCGENSGIKGEEEVKKYGLDNYLVHHKNSELTLLTFNFQLNQLLMLINNPMLFPHAAYAEMFDKNGNGKERDNG